ncbi:unnamed protein product [Somion occarium]|uniref:Amidohydrolase 3 domain-containing protein n=1 Tax=Somion occarium TaxID=3059160 RepID=A0ABP1CTP5_9APHY
MMSRRRGQKVNADQPKTSASTSSSSSSSSSSAFSFPTLALISIAIALALTTSYLYSTRTNSDVISSFTRLPESYALCTPDNVKIYTVVQDRPTVHCLLVSKDRLLATGTLDEIRESWNVLQNELIKKFYGNEPNAKKPLEVFYTKPGSIVVPGLADAHAHLVAYGFKMQLQLDNATSLTDILETLEDYVRSHREVSDNPDQWIQGMGWDQTRWSNWRGGFPTAADLASRPLLSNRPISLSRVDGHALWLSPRALEFTLHSLPGKQWPNDEDVAGGEIRKGEDGQPTGIFVDNAMDLVPAPPPSAEQTEQFARHAMKDALSVGLTSVHDASSMDAGMIGVFKKLADEGDLPIRVYAMASSALPSDGTKPIIEQLHKYGIDGRLDVRSVKVFTDGALGSWGAALLEPYSDDPNTSGIMRIEENELESLVKTWWDSGWGVNIHCIGDRANKFVLDIYERLLWNTSLPSDTIASQRRPRIEHAQIMRVEDLERAGRLGVITSVQPTHATSDMWYAEDRLGPERIKGAYAYQTLLQASPNKILPLGSDFPVEGINPLLGFYAAVARLDVKGNSPHGSSGWYPSERLTRMQALKGMTLDAAYASFADDDIGSFVNGKKADFVVLDRDILDESAVPAREILEAKVLATVVDV